MLLPTVLKYKDIYNTYRFALVQINLENKSCLYCTFVMLQTGHYMDMDMELLTLFRTMFISTCRNARFRPKDINLVNVALLHKLSFTSRML